MPVHPQLSFYNTDDFYLYLAISTFMAYVFTHDEKNKGRVIESLSTYKNYTYALYRPQVDRDIFYGTATYVFEQYLKTKKTEKEHTKLKSY